MFVWIYEVPSYVDIYFAVPEIFVQEERILAIVRRGPRRKGDIVSTLIIDWVDFVVQVSLSHDYILYNIWTMDLDLWTMNDGISWMPGALMLQ